MLKDRYTLFYLSQAFPLDIRKKTQGEKNSELKKKTQTQAKNSTFQHFSKNAENLSCELEF